MKTTIEVQGYEIVIDEMNDKISVSAMRDGEVVEEFELDVEGMGEDDMMGGMEPFEGEEEEDFDSESFDDEEDEEFDEEDEDEDEEDDDESFEEEEDDKVSMKGEKALESFSHFVRKRKR